MAYDVRAIFLADFQQFFGFEPDADVLEDDDSLAQSLHFDQSDIDSFLKHTSLPAADARQLLCQNFRQAVENLAARVCKGNS
jgi:hypothetical protein